MFRSQGRRQRGGRGEFRGRGYRRNRGGHNKDNQAVDINYIGNNHNLFYVAPWPPDQQVPAILPNTIVSNLSQRQTGGPTPLLVRTPEQWKLNKTPTPKQQPVQPNSPQITPNDIRIRRDEDHKSNDGVFGEADLRQQQIRGQRGRRRKRIGKWVVQVKSPWTKAREDLSSQWDHKSQLLIFSYKADHWRQ
ncbi:MAG: hypothetical protein EZS28_003406 [Streblomastix strix]|uniref:Uncharacterized protein n=1 Tax=Streblomastix strix TaxID=222440 RepID=A0A5J4X181_9EUKA|nr:MAG: hypothetical protein EZS28_003406 [Streblomastix strix]